VRKYGEVFVSAVSSVAAALDYPRELIKDSVRPDYWVKDSEACSCKLCDQVFANNIDDMEQSKLRELNGGASGSFQNSPVHAIDVRRHHVRK
jgi:zinc finger FYVE domain-containing protein 1